MEVDDEEPKQLFIILFLNTNKITFRGGKVDQRMNIDTWIDIMSHDLSDRK